MVFRKGQAALDFLMTYGWAIALVVIIAAVLFAMGLFDTSNFVGNKASGFAGLAVKDWSYTASSGEFNVIVTNQVGQPININFVNISVASGAWHQANISGVGTLQVGASSRPLNASGFDTGNIGDGYSAHVVMSYETPSGFNYTSAGTLVGKMA